MSTKPTPPITALNIREVPRQLQRRFRDACALEGKSMRDKILEFMREVAGPREPTNGVQNGNRGG